MAGDERDEGTGAAFSQLLERARSGDEAAVAELHTRYAGDVAARVRKRAPRTLRRRYDVDDVTQSVFVEVLRDLGRFEDRGERAFRSWLFVKVEGKVKQKLGRMLQRDGGRREVTAKSGVLASPPDQAPGPATLIGLRDDVDRLNELVERLTPEQRDVVLLRTRERLGFGEIAERLGLASADAARMRFARGLERLRDAWDRS